MSGGSAGTARCGGNEKTEKKAAAACLRGIRLNYDYPPAPGDIDHPLMSNIDLVRKNLLANCFRNCRNRNNWWKTNDKLISKYRKNRKSDNCNKIQGLEREEIKERPEMSANVSK